MKPERLGDDVRRELVRFGPGGAIAEVVAVWAAAVGESISRHAWPARISRDGTLHVSTSSSAWAFELGLLEDELRDRLSKALEGESPTRLRFAPGRLPEPAAPEGAAPNRGPTVTEQHLQAGEELAATISDENLRKIVAKAAATSLAGRPDDRSV